MWIRIGKYWRNANLIQRELYMSGSNYYLRNSVINGGPNLHKSLLVANSDRAFLEPYVWKRDFFVSSNPILGLNKVSCCLRGSWETTVSLPVLARTCSWLAVCEWPDQAYQLCEWELFSVFIILCSVFLGILRQSKNLKHSYKRKRKAEGPLCAHRY